MTENKPMSYPNFGLNVPRLGAISDHQLNPAKWAHERIVRSIVAFEKELDEDTEIGARLVSFTEKETFHIDDVGYWGPNFVIFYGRNLDGHPVELIQHVSQTSVLLVALPKEDKKPRRIGFILEKKLDQDTAEYQENT